MDKQNSLLEAGETLLWTGTPVEYKEYNRADRWLLPLTMLMLGFSAFYAVTLAFSVSVNGLLPPHLGSLIVLMLAGGASTYAYFFRFSIKRHAKADLAYGVTSFGRVIISDTGRGYTYAFSKEEVRDAAISEIDRNGIGTIYLQPKPARCFLDNTGLEPLLPYDPPVLALFDVPNCKKVYRLICGK